MSEKKEGKIFTKKVKLFLRIGISIILLTYFVTKVDLAETSQLILKTNYYFLILCVLLYMLGQTVSAYKWSIIASTIGFKQKFSNYVQYYFIGMFFNLFLPSTVGGDVGKAYYLYKGESNARKGPAIYSVLGERFSGLAVLITLGTIALQTPIADPVPLWIRYFSLGFLALIVFGAPLFPHVIKRMFSQDNWMNRSLMRDVKVFWDYKLVAICLGWSLVFHSLIVIIHILIGMSMNLNIPILYYIALYPIVAVISFVPFAFNGIGVREGAYIYFLGLIGIKPAVGLAFGILWFMVVVVTSLFGGLIYIKGNHVPPPQDDETDELDLEELAKNEYGELSQHKKLEESQNLISNTNA